MRCTHSTFCGPWKPLCLGEKVTASSSQRSVDFGADGMCSSMGLLGKWVSRVTGSNVCVTISHKWYGVESLGNVVLI